MRMPVSALAIGLLLSGALGFFLGARPDLLVRPFRSSDPTSGRSSLEARDIIDFLYPLAVAFFAGFVFSTLVPDALTHSGGSFLAFAAGVVVMGLLSRFVFKRDPCCEAGHDHRGFGAMSLVAMAVCSLNDGILIGLLNPEWLSGLNIGMIIHKVTSSFAIAQVLKATRFRGWGLAVFGIGYTLISPASYLFAQGPLARNLPDVEEVLAFSAGLLVYVTVTSLIPHARAIIKRRPRTAYGFVLAFIVSISLGFWHTALHKRMEAGGVAGQATDPAGPLPDGGR
jgi:zinc transporter ZupT